MIISSASRWLPTRISNLEAWWSPDRSRKTFNGSNVSQMDDLSGNGRHLVQASASNQPLYVESSNVNGRPALRYDGISSFMSMSGLNGIINGDHTIVFISKVNSTTSAFPCVISWDDAKSLYQYRSDGTFSVFDGSIKILDSNDLRNQVNAQLIVADNVNMICYTNGVEQNTVSYSYVSGAVATYVGMEPDSGLPSNLYNDDISEIFIYSKKVNASEIEFINQYITLRYGL